MHELGLYAIVRPGPHINAELTYFGIPERVVWDPACQARSPGDNPVMLPMVPVGFPVPSYASEAFLAETARGSRWWAPLLAPLRYPDGAHRALSDRQRGGALLSRRALRPGLPPRGHRALPRIFARKVRHRRGAPVRVRAGTSTISTRRHAPHGASTPRAPTISRWHLDWAEFQEQLVAGRLARMRDALAAAGLAGVPTFHNMTMGYEATPLSAARIGTRASTSWGSTTTTAPPRPSD